MLVELKKHEQLHQLYEEVFKRLLTVSPIIQCSTWLNECQAKLSEENSPIEYPGRTMQFFTSCRNFMKDKGYRRNKVSGNWYWKKNKKQCVDETRLSNLTLGDLYEVLPILTEFNVTKFSAGGMRIEMGPKTQALNTVKPNALPEVRTDNWGRILPDDMDI